MVSVVIPIYNVEPFLKRCLDSLLEQSCSDWEAILINDGSTDKSGDVCREYTLLSHSFRYIEQRNQGVAAARQSGVEAAIGEYIIFVDPDDSLPHNALQTLVQSIENEDGIDIVSAGYMVHTKKKSYKREPAPTSFNQDEWIKLLLLDRVNHEPWAKIFRRTLFQAGSFPQLKRGQDWLSNIEVASRVRGVKLIQEVCSNYNHRASSTMRVHNYNLQSDKELCQGAKLILEEGNLYERYKNEHSRMALWQIFIALVKGTQVSLKDEWVAEVYASTSHLKLTLREQIARAAIKWQLLQSLLQSLALIYRKF